MTVVRSPTQALKEIHNIISSIETYHIKPETEYKLIQIESIIITTLSGKDFTFVEGEYNHGNNSVQKKD